MICKITYSRAQIQELEGDMLEYVEKQKTCFFDEKKMQENNLD